MSVRIVQKRKAVWKKNQWGREYRDDDILLEGFEVHGGLFLTTSHTTEKGAEREKEKREKFNQRHPFDMPMSQREKDKAAEMGVNWDRFLCKWARISTCINAPAPVNTH